MKVKELKEQVAELKAQRLTLANSWEQADSQISEDDTIKFDSLSAEIDKIESEIKKQERIEISRANDAAKTRSFSISTGTLVTPEDRTNALRGWLLSQIPGEQVPAKFSQAMEKCGWDKHDRNLMSFDQDIGTAADGGNLLDGSLFQSVVNVMKQMGSVVSEANIVTTSDYGPIHFAVNDDTANGISLVGELSDTSNTSASFSKVTLNAYDYSTAIFPISRQLISSSFPIVPYLGNLLGNRIARGMNSVLSTADGSSKPDSLLHGLSTGVTAAATGAITVGELHSMISSVDSFYYSNAKWMMNRATHSYLIQNLVDDNGRPLLYDFNSGYANGAAPTLLGFPIVYNPDYSDIAASAKVLTFGDHKEAFTVRMVGNVRLASSNELYWKSQATAIAAWVAFDAKVTNSAACKKLVMHAAS